ncbi:MAG: hypothetical protein M1836_007462 [Candelina mexicana]|nr:MAG: hypothetical protein M1836_007462 [Candelina mexicana]
MDLMLLPDDVNRTFTALEVDVDDAFGNPVVKIPIVWESVLSDYGRGCKIGLKPKVTRPNPPPSSPDAEEADDYYDFATWAYIRSGVTQILNQCVEPEVYGGKDDTDIGDLNRLSLYVWETGSLFDLPAPPINDYELAQMHLAAHTLGLFRIDGNGAGSSSSSIGGSSISEDPSRPPAYEPLARYCISTTACATGYKCVPQLPVMTRLLFGSVLSTLSSCLLSK